MVRYCGRDFTPSEIELIRELLAVPQMNRARLSREVCEARMATRQRWLEGHELPRGTESHASRWAHHLATAEKSQTGHVPVAIRISNRRFCRRAPCRVSTWVACKLIRC